MRAWLRQKFCQDHGRLIDIYKHMYGHLVSRNNGTGVDYHLVNEIRMRSWTYAPSMH